MLSQGVDIFAKDFSFLPIHSGPHWTLVIICNPGLQDGDVPAILLHLDSKKGGDAAMLRCCDAAGDEAMRWRVGGGVGHTYRTHSGAPPLHAGIHKPDVILTHLRAYLQHEWARLLRDGGGSNRPKQWQLENGGRPPPDFTDPLVAVSYSPAVPPQPDSSSCGLFVLAETEFFCHAAPNLKQVQDPEVMGKYWCDKHNVSLMREHIRWVRGFAINNCPPPPHPPSVHAEVPRRRRRALVVGLMYGQGAPGGLAAAGGESAAAVAAAGVLASGRGEGPRRAGRMPTSLAGQMQAAPRPSTAFQRQEMRLLCEDYASRGSTCVRFGGCTGCPVR